MSSYASEHASAYTDVLAAGALVTVSRSTPGAETASGGVGAATVTTVEGAAIGKASDAKTLVALGLTASDTQTLFFTPATHVSQSAFVLPGDTLTWATQTWTVRDVGPLLSVNGNVIAATLVCSR